MWMLRSDGGIGTGILLWWVDSEQKGCGGKEGGSGDMESHKAVIAHQKWCLGLPREGTPEAAEAGGQAGRQARWRPRSRPSSILPLQQRFSTSTLMAREGIRGCPIASEIWGKVFCLLVPC